MSDSELDEIDEESKKLIKREQRKVSQAKRYNRKVPKLPNRVVVFKNADKDGNWYEKYDKKHKNIWRLPHPFRLVASGSCGRGKTNTCKRVFLEHQTGKKKFKKLYVVTCSLQAREWLNTDPEAIMTELPDPDIFDGKEKTLLILDDYEFNKSNREQERRLTTLFRFSSTHRNLSIICSYQIFAGVPTVARKCANVFVLYKPNNRLDISLIANRCDLNKEDLQHIFENICNGTYDFLLVDQIPNSPWPLRKNMNEPIELNSEEEEN